MASSGYKAGGAVVRQPLVKRAVSKTHVGARIISQRGAWRALVGRLTRRLLAGAQMSVHVCVSSAARQT